MAELFELCDFFAIRVPRYPIQALDNLNEIDGIFRDDIIFREGVREGNADFYNSLLNCKTLDTSAKIILKNYYKRMATRCTPFGLLAAVDVGYFQEKNSYNEKFRFIPFCDVSNVWLSALVAELEKNIEIISHLKIIANKNVLLKGQRLFLLHNSKQSVENTNANISIKYTFPVKTVLDFCKSATEGKVLIDRLIQLYGVENKDEINNMLITLIQQGYLITSLENKSLTIEHVIYELKNCKSLFCYAEKLEYIKNEIEKVNYNGTYDYGNIEIEMENIQKAKEYLRINSHIKDLNLSIERKIGEDVREAYEWLWENAVVSVNKNDDYKFYGRIVDKYGENVKIPFTEILYLKKQLYIKHESFRNNYFENYVYDKIIKCGQNNEVEVLLGEENLNFENHVKNRETPDLEIFGQLIYQNGDLNNENYKFVVNNFIHSNVIGASIGRFVSILDNSELTNKIKKYNYNENYESVELFFEPIVKKWKNIFNNQDILDNAIGINCFDATDKYLDLNDIFIIASNMKFYIWSERLNKCINLVKVDMFNLSYLPENIKFLYDLFYFNRNYKKHFSFAYLYKLQYCPRIAYKNIILKPITWSISAIAIDPECIKSIEKWLEFFDRFRIENKVHDSVLLVLTDRKLLIDTKCSDDLKLVLKKLKSERVVYFEEHFISTKNYFIKKEKDIYANEIVIGLKGKKQLNIVDNIPLYQNNGYIPFANYLYIKLYTESCDMNETIKSFFAFWQSIKGQFSPEPQMFFIRYTDDAPHLRVRIISDGVVLAKLIPLINQCVEELFREKIINDFKYDTFYPEINRYGGKEYYKFVEEYFCYDSELIIKLLYNRLNQNDIDIILLYNFIETVKLVMPYRAVIKIVDLENKKNKDVIDYNSIRKRLFEVFTDKNIFADIKEMINCKNKKTQLCKLRAIGTEEYKYKILNSLLHMSCNRYSFSDKGLEIRVREMLRCFLRDLKYWQDLIW